MHSRFRWYLLGALDGGQHAVLLWPVWFKDTVFRRIVTFLAPWMAASMASRPVALTGATAACCSPPAATLFLICAPGLQIKFENSC